MIKFITIGADPEFFVLDPKGFPYPATKLASGTKEDPSFIESLGEGFYEQRDNLSLEGNIPPARTKEEFIRNISMLREYFESKVSRFGYSLSSNGVEYFAKRYLSTSEGMEFGCSSVVSSWDSCLGSISLRPTPNLSDCKFRVAGFHIHIGFSLSYDSFESHMGLIVGRLFDIFLTVPSHLIKPEPERTRTYGKFGIVRLPDYGVECRTLSSFFTQKQWLPWVWDQLMKIESFINNADPDDIINIILDRYMIGATIFDMAKVFANMFSKFKNKEILNSFYETRDFYESEPKNVTDYYSYRNSPEFINIVASPVPALPI